MKSKYISLIIIISAFSLGLFFYPKLPASVPSHWDIEGNVNGYVSRFWGAFLMPMIIFGMYLLIQLIIKIDPKQENIEKFRKYFSRFMAVLLGFMLYVYVLSLIWANGAVFNMMRLLTPAFSILFYSIGVLIGKAEQNWSIGIRTPWTLSSETVWKKTHLLGSKLVKITALFSLVGLIFARYSLWISIVPTVAVLLFLVIYSYIEFRKIKKS